MHVQLGETVLCTPRLSVDVQSAATGMNVPLTCLEGIWPKKAVDLHVLSDKKAMILAPGQSTEARMVVS
jgi:hypothetical protein